MDNSTEQAIEAMVQRLVEHFAPDQIILFGSHARGTATPDSDVDLLVVVPISGSKRAIQLENEISRRGNIAGTVIYPALREGKVLYARG
jgi:predicted nucleotidyltransferase